jgi:hypothetical protein
MRSGCWRGEKASPEKWRPNPKLWIVSRILPGSQKANKGQVSKNLRQWSQVDADSWHGLFDTSAASFLRHEGGQSLRLEVR